MYKIFFIAFSLLSALPAKDLVTYKTSFEKQMSIIESSHEKKNDKLNTSYDKVLDKLLIAVQKTGNLDHATTVQDEVERFFKSKTIPTSLSKNKVLQKKKTPFIKEFLKYRLARAKKILKLVSKYEVILSSLQKKLVVAGKLSEANSRGTKAGQFQS